MLKLQITGSDARRLRRILHAMLDRPEVRHNPEELEAARRLVEQLRPLLRRRRKHAALP